MAYLVACTAIGRYPASYTGWKPKLRKDGAYATIIWVIGPSGAMVRDGMQNHLLGDVGGGNAGSGLIPKDNIVSMQAARGIGGLIDFVVTCCIPNFHVVRLGVLSTPHFQVFSKKQE